MRYAPPHGHPSVLGLGTRRSFDQSPPLHSQQLAQQALALCQRQQFSQAWPLFANLSDEDLSRLQLTATAAECAQRANQVNDAARLYRLALTAQQVAAKKKHSGRAETPTTLRLRFNLALVCFQLQDWDACIEQLVKVQQANPTHSRSAELLIQARLIRANPKDIPQAVAGLRKQLNADPLNQKAIQLWAETRWLQNEADWCVPYDKALQMAGHENLLVDYLLKLTSLGLLQQGQSVLTRYRAEQSAVTPYFLYAEALLLYQQGAAQRALANLEQLPSAWLSNYAVEELYIKALLATGACDQALSLAQRRVTPASRAIGNQTKRVEQGDWALLATALKKSGQWADYRHLYDFDRFVKVFPITTPPGFNDIDSFHQKLITELDRQHRDKNHPLNQSLRSGSQTSGHLFKAAASQQQRHIIALEQAIQQQVAKYVANLPEDNTHPFLSRRTLSARDRDLLVSGAWSVKLRKQGFHINHFHNEGWISGCYYVQTPDALDNQGQGWIKFGQMESSQTIDDAPDYVVRPQAGHVVFFPSYMWHGTNAFTDDRFRITVAFDLVPAAT